MITIYIKQWKREEIFNKYKLPNWIKNIAYNIIKKLNYIRIKEIGENKKLYLISNATKESTYKKIRKKLEKEKTKTQKMQIVLAKKIKPYKAYFQGYKIVDGKSTYIYSIENLLENILEEQPLALQDIYLLTNHYTAESTNLIKKIAPKVKTMNIITKEIEKYKALEEILQEQGIIMSISNNKKKSLKKAKIIINVDFSNEQLTQYSIFRNSIFINIAEEKTIQIQGFQGIMVQTIQLQLNEENIQWVQQNKLEDEFVQLEIYESLQECKTDKNQIKIENLYGNHGKIDKKELRNWQKILTNEKN